MILKEVKDLSNMRMKSNKLRFGVSYCPYAKSADVEMKYWERDFQTMKKLNFNTLRCFVAWDRIEQQEGKYDFSKTDFIFELADKYKMDIILNIGGVFDCYGGIYAPRWLIYDYNCQQIVENPNVEFKPFGAMPRICNDDPVFTEKSMEFTIRAIKRYKDQDKLCAWNVWNEAALDHMCYCPVTIQKFQNWLKNKYKDNLDELNTKWGTEYPVNFRNWEMIEPGLGSGFSGGGHVPRLDWMRFNRDKVTGWVKGVNDLVHEHDSGKHPTTSNIVRSAVMEVKHLNCPDVWSQNHNLDIGGMSFYGQNYSGSDNSYYLSNVRSSSSAEDKQFWILETCAGQQFGPELSPGDCCDRELRTLMNWQSVLHGAKMILLWKFGGRVTDNQTDVFNLMAWDGGITDRALNNAEFAEKYLENEKLFLDKAYNSEVAILTTYEGILYNIVDNSLNSYAKSKESRFGAYQMMRDLRLQSDLISEIQVREGKLSEYRALIIPWSEVMSPDLASQITKFVENGGIVVADRCLNLKDTNSRIHYRAPGNGLTKVFGGYINDMLLTPIDEKITTEFGELAVGSHRKAIIHTYETAEVVGAYRNCTTGAAINSYGKGKTLWFGTDIFHDYRLKKDNVASKVIESFLRKNGIESDYEVVGNTVNVEFGALNQNNDKVHFIINSSAKPCDFELNIKSAQGRLNDLLSEFFYEEKCQVSMAPYEVKILYS